MSANKSQMHTHTGDARRPSTRGSEQTRTGSISIPCSAKCLRLMLAVGVKTILMLHTFFFLLVFAAVSHPVARQLLGGSSLYCGWIELMFVCFASWIRWLLPVAIVRSEHLPNNVCNICISKPFCSSVPDGECLCAAARTVAYRFTGLATHTHTERKAKSNGGDERKKSTTTEIARSYGTSNSRAIS